MVEGLGRYADKRTGVVLVVGDMCLELQWNYSSNDIGNSWEVWWWSVVAWRNRMKGGLLEKWSDFVHFGQTFFLKR